MSSSSSSVEASRDHPNLGSASRLFFRAQGYALNHSWVVIRRSTWRETAQPAATSSGPRASQVARENEKPRGAFLRKLFRRNSQCYYSPLFQIRIAKSARYQALAHSPRQSAVKTTLERIGRATTDFYRTIRGRGEMRRAARLALRPTRHLAFIFTTIYSRFAGRPCRKRDRGKSLKAITRKIAYK